jgi:hypothetical protein
LQQILAMCLMWDNVVADTLSRLPSHTAGPDSCFHTAGPESCSHSTRDVSVVSPSAELLDCAGIAKNQVTCSLDKKATSSSSLRLVHNEAWDSCSNFGGPDSCFHTAGLDSCSHAARAVSAVSPSVDLLDYANIAKNQLTCPLDKKAASSSSLRLVHINVHGQQLLCDMSRGGQRPLIPEVDRKRVFRAFHELSHPGKRATRRLMSARVIWRIMSSDIAAWCRDCQQCSRGKASPQPAAPI